ncbi:hypothetical protein A6P39_037830 [Streptomyces sp. FXJ1.172]|uniref:hypothetical protein n=1 Tax=Streptomyces sp. FXJ1.172 TaxID=710705 RepID=UPI0007CFFD01|nr:hypothetical protein [Streptomyces sp. FXJ1.172]WEO99337.1 hypothetical protein A6P39_037830 [Streptomyces sp. FXJ1.172]
MSCRNVAQRAEAAVRRFGPDLTRPDLAGPDLAAGDAPVQGPVPCGDAVGECRGDAADVPPPGAGSGMTAAAGMA